MAILEGLIYFQYNDAKKDYEKNLSATEMNHIFKNIDLCQHTLAKFKELHGTLPSVEKLLTQHKPQI